MSTWPKLFYSRPRVPSAVPALPSPVVQYHDTEKEATRGRHPIGSRTKAAGNPQPSGWPKHNEKIDRRRKEFDQAEQAAIFMELEQAEQAAMLRKNAQTIAAEGIDNLLLIVDGDTKHAAAEEAPAKHAAAEEALAKKAKKGAAEVDPAKKATHGAAEEAPAKRGAAEEAFGKKAK